MSSFTVDTDQLRVAAAQWSEAAEPLATSFSTTADAIPFDFVSMSPIDNALFKGNQPTFDVIRLGTAVENASAAESQTITQTAIAYEMIERMNEAAAQRINVPGEGER